MEQDTEHRCYMGERKFDACGEFSGDPRFPKKNLSFAHAPYRRPGRKGGVRKWALSGERASVLYIWVNQDGDGTLLSRYTLEQW